MDNFKYMFTMKELMIMINDPLDLLVENINSILFKNKTIKFLFS